jgi:hypothetical protein
MLCRKYVRQPLEFGAKPGHTQESECFQNSYLEGKQNRRHIGLGAYESVALPLSYPGVRP